MKLLSGQLADAPKNPSPTLQPADGLASRRSAAKKRVEHSTVESAANLPPRNFSLPPIGAARYLRTTAFTSNRKEETSWPAISEGSGADVKPKTSYEMHAVGKLPAPGLERWNYLAKAENWRPERQQLHDTLISEAVANALKFADAIERSGHEPTLFALRGNTAAGKTRMATQVIPVLANALKESKGECVNPDIFKSRLANVPGHDTLNSAQVHAESCMLADRLEADLRSRKTRSGAPASMLVDKRLAGAHEIEAYIKLAVETGRKVELCDVDMPLERSLLGVLQRKPAGESPRPPYVAVSNGFAAVRRDRLDIIDKFITKPELGSYHLFGTAPNGDKVKVASVIGGELTIAEPHLYKSITSPETTLAGDTADKVIDTSLIDRLTSGMSDAHHAQEARSALQAYAGMTWSQALQIHSSLTD